MAADPYKYFRIEARELIDELGRDVLALEKEATPEIAARLLRHAHTLKGAARVVKQRAIAEDAHAIEEALEPARDGRTPLGRDAIEVVLARLDAMSAALATLDPAPAPSPTAPRTAEPAPVTRTDADEMDRLLDGVSEAAIHLQSMRVVAGDAERARHVAQLLAEHTSLDAGASVRARALADELRGIVGGFGRSLARGVDQLERELVLVREAAERIRLVPVTTIVGALQRAARDDAAALGKEITFVAPPNTVRLDAHVLGAVQQALVQVVRNAIAHGIEPATDRERAGKPAAGRVTLTSLRSGAHVVFACEDDGRGFDLAAIREIAVRRGGDRARIDALPDADVLRLLLEAGVTTSSSVTEISGRGVGLDVVRDIAARLGGSVRLVALPVGARVEIVVPVSLSSLTALVVEAGGVTAAIPLDAVRRTVRLATTEIAHGPAGDTIVHDRAVLPLMTLGHAFPRCRVVERPATSVVVIDGAAIAVDRLVGTAEIVVRRLPPAAASRGFVSGATLDAEGNPQLVLDPERLAAAAREPRRRASTASARVKRPILVIDDSLTTRMLEQSILEAAGYEVDTASSAEEGLEKAKLRRYGLFLVDVEMPGMDGFGFVATTRSDAVLRETPAILVSSRSSAEDRRRGTEAGAHAYVVKGEFDQKLLLDTIRRLEV